ncbi:MAG: FAD:protein FMN transferase [Planctomycetota bacterium]|nr:FAD:protein FMN transferase [Planctomycetota bacterium]
MRPRPPKPRWTGLAAASAAVGLLACAGGPGATEPRRAEQGTPDSAPQASTRVERQIAAMGTALVVEIEAPSRAEALAASEVAARALEAAEQRLSTWRADSELSRLNAADVGSSVALSPELATELAVAVHWARATQGAFDPAVGALVDAWGLRGAGRIPSAREIEGALVPGGIARALGLEGQQAVRLQPALRLEEGGFGKGAGLDAALRALHGTAARSATLDFGGQIAWYASEPVAGSASARDGQALDPWLEIADPRDRSRSIARVRTARASAATSANSEHARTVAGRRIGHILDPRTGEPAADFGSVTVLADRAIDADCLSTGLFVLGPDRALEFAEQHGGIDVVVAEQLSSGDLRLRASAGIAASLEVLVPDVILQSNVHAPSPGSLSHGHPPELKSP